MSRRLRHECLGLVFFAFVFAWASPVWAQATPHWHGGERQYRVGFQAGANGFARTNKATDISLDLQALLTQAGGSGTVNSTSLLVVEVTSAGLLVDGVVPFQFDGTPTGKLVWIMEGLTAAPITRYYQLYFDTSAFTAPSFSDQVSVLDGIVDQGQASIRVIAGPATYFFHKEGGGFSSILDSAGNDWVNYSTAAGSAGQFRGVPNLVFPGDLYHPGFTHVSSTLVHDGPIKATVESPSDNGQFRTRWEFYPDHARMTVLQASSNYWFLYEGTPGGHLDRVAPNNDYLMRSSGNQYSVADNWGTGLDIPGDEWVYFVDPVVAKSLFLAHHTSDSLADYFAPSDSPAGGPDSDWMTVFGFGRSSASSLLSGTGRQFTIGMLNGTDFTQNASAIRAAYKPLTMGVGTAEMLSDCGNGVQAPDEGCDDGNSANGDGCDAECVVEECGNGVTQSGEQCDDGNADDLDACSNDCVLNVCGDGQVNNGEPCDDGNLIDDDACRNDCTEPGCGDGQLDPGEECDDGNSNGADGCTNNCRLNSWHGGERQYRVGFQAGANGFARTNKVTEVALNLQGLLTEAGGSGTVHTTSLLVVEVTPAGLLVDDDVPFQFDGTSSGNLVWTLEGVTAVGATRHYQLYFDTSPYSPPVFSDEVSVLDGIIDEGQSSIRVSTDLATYFFQKEAGGFSSLLDSENNDWINFSTAPGSAGMFRGIPNLVFPGDLFHPGFPHASSTLIFDGPIKATVESPSDNGQYRTRW